MKRPMSLETWISRCNEKHNFKYDYSLMKEYKRGKDKATIICHEKDKFGNEHGVFHTRCENHLYEGNGCPKCANVARMDSVRMTLGEFVRKSFEMHYGKYSYEKTKQFQSGHEDKVIITCPIHGDFIQTPHAHLRGQGCPYCKTSKLENDVAEEVSKHYNIIRQHKFDWLGRQSLDIYIPEYNVAIECQGEQHFEPIDFGNRGEEWSNENLKHIQELDATKKLLCEEHNVKLLYFGKKKYCDEIIISTDVLLAKIKE